MAEDVNIKINVDTSKADKSTESLKQRMRELRDRMAELQAAGKDTSEEYQRMAAEAGKLRDAMGDVDQEIRNLANDNQTLAATMQGVGAGVAVFGGLQAATALLGVEDKNLLQIMQKVQATQALLNSVNTIAQALNKSSALMTALRVRSEKALNKELVQTTQAETKGTAATTAYTAAEGAATTGAITLKGAVKAVGTAIKSVPVVGWILAAIAAITTLISLISDANDEEERGNELIEERKKKLEEVEKAHRDNIKAIRDENTELSKLLDSISNGSGALYEDAIKGLASYTGVAEEYLRTLSSEEAEALKNKVLNYKETKENLADLQRQFDEGLVEVGSERFSEIQRQIWAGQASVKAYEESINAEREKGYKFVKNQAAATKQLEEAEKARAKFVEDSKKEIEELNNAIYGQGDEEKITEHYDRLLDLAVKYYGEESEQVALVSEKRLQALEELRKKQSEVDEALAKEQLEDDRRHEDERLQVRENAIKTETELLAEGSQEWYEKKIELDRHQEDREKLELERKLQDNLISQELYLSEYDRLTAEHANARAEIEMEANKKVADDYKAKMQQRLAYAETFANAFGGIVDSALEAELAAVGDNEERQKAVRKKYAKAKFLSEIAGIGVNTASAIMGAWESVASIVFPGNVIAGGILTAMLAATGAMQTATAMSEMNRALSYRRGGLLYGKSHEEGGIKTDGGIELEGGEAVLNKRAVAAFAPLLSAINQSTGGVPINVVGASQSKTQVVSTVDKKALREIVAEVVGGVTSIPVTVTQRDITDAQTERHTIVTRGLI
ncbi:MAG: hypothetical protein IIW86_02380 [Clostridia bacterium]|nr:hypothetical protein [Clostridia bacterium]